MIPSVGGKSVIFVPRLICLHYQLPLPFTILTRKGLIRDYFSLQEDLYYPHPLVQDLLWDGLYIFTEPFLNRWPFNKLREKALQVTMKHIHYEDENSRYITIGCVEKVRELAF